MAEGAVETVRGDSVGVSLTQGMFHPSEERPAEKAPDEGGKTPEAKPETTPEKTEEAEHKEPEKPEEVRLPWDPVRQEKDQELANARKQIDQLTGRIAALETRKTADGEEVEVTVEDLQKAEGQVEKLEGEPPDEYAEDEERRAYSIKLKKAKTRVRTLTYALLGAKKPGGPPAKPAEEPVKPSETQQSDGATHADFNAFLTEADAKYGAKYRKTAAPAIVRELQAAGFKSENPAPKALLWEMIRRVYAEVKSNGGVAEPAPKKDDAPRMLGPSPAGPKNWTGTEDLDDVAAEMATRRRGK